MGDHNDRLGRRWRGVRASVAVPAVVLTVFFVLPVSSVLLDSVSGEAGVTLRHVWEAASKTINVKALLFTLNETLVSVFFSLLLGVPVGALLALYSIKLRRLVLAASVAAFMTPPTVLALGFILAFGSRGLLSSTLPFLRVFGEGYWAIILAHVYYNSPLVAHLVAASLSRVDRSLAEAAEALGASRLKVLGSIYMPQALSGVASGAILVFLYCFMSFTIPLILGGGRYRTLEVRVYSLYKSYGDVNGAAALALLQTLVLLTIVCLYVVTVLRRGEEVLTGWGGEGGGVKIRSWAEAAAVHASLTAYLFFLLIPPSAVMVHSVWKGGVSAYARLVSPEYSRVLGTSPLQVMINSVGIALSVAVTSTMIGVILAYAYTRGGGSSRLFMTVLSLAPLAVSPITLALGMYRTYGKLEPLYSFTLPLIVAAHVVAALPLSSRIITSTILRVPREMSEAAYVVGSSDYRAFVDVEIPLASRGLISAFSFSLAASLGEFGATLFLMRPEYTTLSVSIYRYVGARMFDVASAAGSLLFLLTVASLLVVERLGEKVVRPSWLR